MTIVFVLILILLVYYVLAQTRGDFTCGNVLYNGENPGYYPGPYVSSMPMWFTTPY